MINEDYVTGLRFKLTDLKSEALQTALANTAHRTSENAKATFLLTETLDNLQFQGVLKSRYIAGQWFKLWKSGFLLRNGLNRAYCSVSVRLKCQF